MCQMMKSNNRAKAGLLQLLEIPSRKWAHVTTDLVPNLPASNGFTTIVVFIDKLARIVHLKGCKMKVTAIEYAHIFVDNVFRLHGLLEVIMSDQDPTLLASFGEHCSTRSEWISDSIPYFICKQMDNQSG